MKILNKVIVVLLLNLLSDILCSNDFICDFKRKGFHKYAENKIPDFILDHFLQKSDAPYADPIDKDAFRKARGHNEFRFGDLLWPDGVVPLAFEMRKKEELKIWKISEMISNNTCIKFVPKNHSHHDFVNFKFGRDMGSYIGRIGGKQDVAISWLSRYEVLHTLMHVLGLVHQNQLPLRDEFIVLNKRNIRRGNRKDYRNLEPFDQSFGIIYEYESATHVSPRTGAYNKLVDTYATKDPMGFMGLAQAPSQGDIWKIKVIYSCPGYIDLNVSCEKTLEDRRIGQTQGKDKNKEDYGKDVNAEDGAIHDNYVRDGEDYMINEYQKYMDDY
ncbi:astacin-like metalloprotease toxin 3 [Hermetia illucens]|nr:astacin-like metalloprotease toxin 3 [Hermetia illucens]